MGTHFSRRACVLALAAVALSGCLFAGPRHQGPPTAHFDGEQFRNQGDVPRINPFHLLGAALAEEPGTWRPYTDSPPGPPPPRRVGPGRLRVTFIGHATTLVQVDGLNILTDPIYSERASPVSFVGPRRVRPPGLRFEDLPPIDAVVVSHNHYDHMDLPTLRRLAESHRPRIFVGLGNKALLDAAGIPGAEELDWWQSAQLGPGRTVTAVPAQHRSNRGLTDSAATLWAGYVVHSAAGPVYFAGDTGLGPHVAQVAERFGPVRLAILPIGAFRPSVIHSVHMGPPEALEAHRVLRAGTSVAMHYGTFPLALDGQDEARYLLLRLLMREQPRPRFWTLGFGEGRYVP